MARRIESALQVRKEALRQAEALDDLMRRVELQHARAEEAVVGRRRAVDGVERGKERLQEHLGRVLPLSRAIATAQQRVQEAKVALSGDERPGFRMCRGCSGEGTTVHGSPGCCLV